MRRLLMESFRYALASGCALLVDMIIVAVLVEEFNWPYLAAASISFLLGSVVAYLISVKMVFQHRRVADRRAEFVSFAAIGGVGLAVNAGVMSIAVKIFGLHFLIAKLFAAAFSFASNFVTRRQLLFVQRPTI